MIVVWGLISFYLVEVVERYQLLRNPKTSTESQLFPLRLDCRLQRFQVHVASVDHLQTEDQKR